MNWLDLLIILTLAGAGLGGARKGLVHEVFGLVVTVIIFLFGFRFAPTVGAAVFGAVWPAGQPLFPVVGFLIITCAASLVLGAVMVIWRQLSRAAHLSWLDSLGGAAFGLAKSGLALMILLVLAAVLPVPPVQDTLRSSRLAPYFLDAAPTLYRKFEVYLPKTLPFPSAVQTPGTSDPRRPSTPATPAPRGQEPVQRPGWQWPKLRPLPPSDDRSNWQEVNLGVSA